MSEVTRKRKFHLLQKYCNELKSRYLIGQNQDAISKLQSLYKVDLNTTSKGELSDPLCDSINRGSDFSQIDTANHYKTINIICKFD